MWGVGTWLGVVTQCILNLDNHLVKGEGWGIMGSL